jgi:hypothetical protein
VGRALYGKAQASTGVPARRYAAAVADDNNNARTRGVEIRATEDGVEVETADSNASEIVLIPWDQAVKVARRIIELARPRGDVSVLDSQLREAVRADVEELQYAQAVVNLALSISGDASSDRIPGLSLALTAFAAALSRTIENLKETK